MTGLLKLLKLTSSWWLCKVCPPQPIVVDVSTKLCFVNGQNKKVVFLRYAGQSTVREVWHYYAQEKVPILEIYKALLYYWKSNTPDFTHWNDIIHVFNVLASQLNSRLQNKRRLRKRISRSLYATVG